MALLNPPELRPSVILAITRYLCTQRAQQDTRERLLATMAPETLGGTDPQRDVSSNLTAAIELGMVVELDGTVRLADGLQSAMKAGPVAATKVLRECVLVDHLNSSVWPSQVGARDLTNALSWFLTFSPSESPTQMENAPRSAQVLQSRDFGPRQADESSNWPIGNATRWNAFRRWACSLGFAWVSPNGNLVPDPTPAVRDALSEIFTSAVELTASDFVDRVGACLPIMDRGRYQQFVIQNWERPPSESRGISASLTEALDRLTIEGAILVDDRADAARLAKSDGLTFSHVRIGRQS
ncbi:protein DpdG [Nocardia sp. 348MFTsu5.1]|uniref:protein DpdG n=1 Tax=Nocardia sp. 348MFTsu5.1 TaxID=1172185 RepID=UPI0012DFD398|nr:protein DpdG [Nocardia sp. 348MFTsu5.1]